MAHVAQMLTQEPIYKSSSVFCFKPILISAHKLILLIYGDNSAIGGWCADVRALPGRSSVCRSLVWRAHMMVCLVLVVYVLQRGV